MQQRLDFPLSVTATQRRVGGNSGCMHILQDVIRNIPLEEVARRLGLHHNTVARWFDMGAVPNHYAGDFKRMLGQNGDPDDQFYTNADVARQCLDTFKGVATDLGVNLSRYWFIEPSAGSGQFYNLLPPKRRIGLDLHPRHKEVRRKDFLLYAPKKDKKYVVLGNPPFGLRGHLALQFINHSFPFADMVAFILPQLFESDGKGVPAKRVNSGFKLAHSEKLPADSFHLPDGTGTEISTIFQVWSKVAHDRIKIQPRKTCRSFIKIYSLSNGGTPASTRNKHMIGKCDVYLPSTCFSGMQAYSNFEELPNKRGYGIVVHKEKRKIIRLIKEQDWNRTSFPSTNGALNLRSSLIEDIVVGGGFQDE